MTTATVIDVLTNQEVSYLAELESQIKQGLQEFMKVGTALAEINRLRLYRANYPNFETYCQQVWNFTRQHAHNLISAAGVASSLSTLVYSSELNERNLRPIRSLPTGEQKAVLQMAKLTAPDEPLTTSRVQAAKNVYDGIKASGGYVDTGNGESTAFAAAVTQEEYELKQRQREHISANAAPPLVKATMTVSEAIESLQGLLAAKGDLRVRVVVYEVEK